MKSNITDKEYFPQRKPNKDMSGEELLNKAAYGTPKARTDKQLLDEELKKIIKK